MINCDSKISVIFHVRFGQWSFFRTRSCLTLRIKYTCNINNSRVWDFFPDELYSSLYSATKYCIFLQFICDGQPVEHSGWLENAINLVRIWEACLICVTQNSNLNGPIVVFYTDIFKFLQDHFICFFNRGCKTS